MRPYCMCRRCASMPKPSQTASAIHWVQSDAARSRRLMRDQLGQNVLSFPQMVQYREAADVFDRPDTG
jgi:hypothetical protein